MVKLLETSAGLPTGENPDMFLALISRSWERREELTSEIKMKAPRPYLDSAEQHSPFFGSLSSLSGSEDDILRWQQESSMRNSACIVRRSRP